MSKGILTENHKVIMQLLRALGATKEEIISAMPMVEDDERAKSVLSILLNAYDNREEMTLERMLEITKKNINGKKITMQGLQLEFQKNMQKSLKENNLSFNDWCKNKIIEELGKG